MLVVFNLLTLRLAGTLGVAAYGIVANLALMALALFTGVNQGVQPLVSLAHGRGRRRVRTLCRMALGLALCAGLCMAALAFFAAGPLVSLFNRDGDPALQQMAEQGLRLYFLGFPFAGLNLITASFLGAAEHPGRSLRLSLLRGFVSIVAAALLLAALLALTGVWLAFPAAEGPFSSSACASAAPSGAPGQSPPLRPSPPRSGNTRTPRTPPGSAPGGWRAPPAHGLGTPAGRGMDVGIGVDGEAAPLVEALPPPGDLVHRRVDLQYHGFPIPAQLLQRLGP